MDSVPAKLLAYCLMGNHIHLLIRVGKESIEQVFNRIGGRLVYWYNVKYQRVDHLFQDRFKSEPVDNDTYLLTVIRFIHQNPVKAGICDKPEDYPYSSWREHLAEPWIAAVSFTDTLISRGELIDFHKQLGQECCLDISEAPDNRFTVEQAQATLARVSGCNSVSDFQKLTPIGRDKAIRQLRKAHFSLRQISRLTSVSLKIICRIVEEA